MLELTAFLLAFSAAFAGIVLIRPLCLQLGHVDSPAGGHKRHECMTPLCGGFGIVLAVLVVGACLAYSRSYLGLAAGLLLVTLLGTRDDARHVSARVRLTIQSFAVLACMVGIGGVELSSLGALVSSEPVTLGMLGTVFTLFAVVGVINAVNMIDGVDGLAGGYAFLVFGVMAVAAALAGRPELTLVCAFAGAVGAFLCFNMRMPLRRRPASVFLGDAGSLALGFGLAWFAVALSQGEAPALRPITMIWLFGLPLVDTGYLMIARTVINGNPMCADRRHFHHLLLRAGYSPGRACVVWLGAASLFMLVGVASEYHGIPEVAMFYLFWIAFAGYCAAMAYAWSRLALAMRTATQSA